MTRIDLKYSVFLRMARLLASLGTCARRQVGCVLTDQRFRVLSTGYNGSPAGATHCTDAPCAGAHLPSGTGLDVCRAIHAEQNALVSLRDPDQVFYVFCTTAPCMHCVKMLATTAASVILFTDDYPQSEQAAAYWRSLGRTWIHFDKCN